MSSIAGIDSKDQSGMATLAVLGAGSWGTALGVVLARNGLEVRLWGHDAAHLSRMERLRENDRHLPGVALPANLVMTADLRAALVDVDALVIAVPSHAFRDVLTSVSTFVDAVPAINATKGFDPGTARLLHEVHADIRGGAPFMVLSGPTFASEVAAGLPTAVTLAGIDATSVTRCAAWFHNDYFRVYTSTDVVGVEVAGATKNIFAIAAGIAEGLRFGANGRAALITRGLAEMVRLGKALGGHYETFMGLSGVGDLILTCTEDKSRNRRLGLALGHGVDVNSASKQIDQVVEGVAATREVMQLAQRMNIPMPIVEQVYAVLFQQCDPHQAVRNLLQRAPTVEWRGA